MDEPVDASHRGERRLHGTIIPRRMPSAAAPGEDIGLSDENIALGLAIANQLVPAGENKRHSLGSRDRDGDHQQQAGTDRRSGMGVSCADDDPQPLRFLMQDGSPANNKNQS